MQTIRRRSTVVVALVFLGLLPLALPASAGVGAWTPLGPEGGRVSGLAVAPDDPDVVYAGTKAGVFRSTDGGETWTFASRGLFLQRAAVFPGAAGPGGVLYVATERGVFRTTDGAQTWVAAAGLPEPAQALAVDPLSPQRVWAAAGRRSVYLSRDGGATWTPRSTGLPDAFINQLAVSADGAWIYAATDRGFYRSSNRGLTWVPGAGFHRQAWLTHLAIDAHTPATLYATTGHSGLLYRSRNHGATWSLVTAHGVLSQYVDQIAVQGDRVYAALFEKGIVVSLDGGDTWAPVEEQPEDVLVIAFVASPRALFVGAVGFGHAGGVYRSLDHGRSWEAFRAGLEALPVSGVEVHPSNPDILFVAAGYAGAFRSLDRGATWEHLDLKINDRNFYYASDVLVDPAYPSVVHVSNLEGGVSFESGDGGDTWQRRDELPVFRLAADRRTPGALWATGYQGLYNSASGPIELPETLKFAELGVLEVSPADPAVLWVGGAVVETDGTLRPRLFHSADAGRTWERRDRGLAGKVVSSLAIDPAAPGTLYAATDSGLFRSTDGGSTWIRSPLVGKVTQVVAAPTHPTGVYAFLAGFGVMRSTDQGDTWSPASRGLSVTQVLDLAVDPNDPHRLYAGTASRGLFEYTQP
ncbi:MAG TPA: hypothetical protein VH394_00590 [Thermoanaerobaculia bacterium]|jgi:photosystem II stability/assembly factor-like uncharacterized protein|nr:hypothetical protein [Thermoanaerobaculia bacterium]